jgi:hypothetical protein
MTTRFAFRMHAPARWTIAVAVSCTVLASGAAARADASGDARVAQALFEEARVLMDQKRFAEACPKLAESQRLDPGGGTILNLAVCHAGEGKMATALLEYHEALAVAVRDGRKDREAIARSSIEALERDVPRITIASTAPSEIWEVKLDTLVLPKAAWGVAMPVDPGAHVVAVKAAGKAEASVTVTVARGDKKTIDVPLPSAPALEPLAPTAYTPTEAPPRVVRGAARPNPVFYAALGIAIVGGATAVITGGLAASENGAANDGCIESRAWCRDAASRDAHESARTFAWVSTGALAVALAGTLVVLLTPSRREGALRSAKVGPIRWSGIGMVTAF